MKHAKIFLTGVVRIIVSFMIIFGIMLPLLMTCKTNNLYYLLVYSPILLLTIYCTGMDEDKTYPKKG